MQISHHEGPMSLFSASDFLRWARASSRAIDGHAAEAPGYLGLCAVLDAAEALARLRMARVGAIQVFAYMAATQDEFRGCQAAEEFLSHFHAVNAMVKDYLSDAADIAAGN
jgi:hypothetical protein